MSIKRLIVAGTTDEWRQYCREFGYDPRESPLVRFSDQVHGLASLDVHYVGQYYKLDDLKEIEDYCREHNMTVPA